MTDHGVVCSMSRSGNVWDNAAMESFFSSLKTERTARKLYRTWDDAKADVFDYIELGLLMPFFFLLAGLRTLIELNSLVLLEVFVIATAVAVVGKVGGTALAARFVGQSWPNALALGALLQTKGLWRWSC
jgi:transposase InsO family protein